MRRPVRRTIIVLAVVLGLLAAADVGLRLLAQYWVGRTTAASMGMRERPSVSIGGFPFLWHLASGEFPSVTITSRGPVSGGTVPLESARVVLHDVHISSGQLLFGTSSTITAKKGTGTATLTAADLNAAIASDTSAHVRFDGSTVVVTSPSLPGKVEAKVSIQNGELVLRPVGGRIPVSVHVRLPDLIQGVHFTGVAITSGEATLSFTLTDASFEVPGRGS